MFKKFFLIGLLLFLASITFADIGPSPSYSLTVINASDYQDYGFYYAGNIWPDKLESITGETFVYKLNTNITIYALPNEIEVEQGSIPEEAIKTAQIISLKSGFTKFEVISLDEASGYLVVQEEKSNSPKTKGFFDAIICFFAQLFGGSC